MVTTAEKLLGPVMNTIAARNAFFFALKEKGIFKGLNDLGQSANFPNVYEQGGFGVYAGNDTLPQSQIDGMTDAEYQWRQAVADLTITGIERAKNKGASRKKDLFETRTMQVMTGFVEGFTKAVFQGQGVNANTAGNIETAFLDPTTARAFVDPIPLLVKKDPTTGSVGKLDPSTRTWWQNHAQASTATTFAGLWKEIRSFDLQMMENAGHRVKPKSVIYLTDRFFVEVYEASLRSQNRFTDQRLADFPFEHVLIHGKPATWDGFLPNWQDRDTTQEQAKATLVAIDSASMGLYYYRPLGNVGERKTDFRVPARQDSETAYFLWYGALGTGNRREHGVLYNIDGTIAS
ncbi:MAG: phage major capsid protein [Acidobacteriota bacterium]